MKIFFLVIVVFFVNFFSFSQEPPKLPKYIAKNVANIFYYDLGEALEKSKIKKEETGNRTKKALRIYNDKVKNISFLNFQKLNDLEIIVNSMGEKINKDLDLAIKIRKQVKETILPVRDSIKKNEDILNKTLKSFLSKKQYKKWIKHQNFKKRELLPKAPQNNNSAPTQNPIRNGRNRRGGF